MFRCNLMVRKPFVSSQRLKAGRPRKTVKLNLESLTERILLSASAVQPPPSAPTPIAQVTALVVSTMDQWNHLFASVEQELSSALQVIEQQLDQDVAFVQQQWDQFLGIAPNAPDLSPAAGQQTSSGAARTPEAAASIPPSTSKPSNQVLAQPLLAQVDEYVWDPPNPQTDIHAGNAGNWLLNGLRSTTVPGTKASDVAHFAPDDAAIKDGNGNAPIDWDYQATFDSITLGGSQAAYTGLQTILAAC